MSWGAGGRRLSEASPSRQVSLDGGQVNFKEVPKMPNVQPWLTIQGTPLQLNLIYAEDGGTTAANHPLVGNKTLTPLGDEIVTLLDSLATSGSNSLSALNSFVQPLDQLVTTYWTQPSTQQWLSTAVSDAIAGQVNGTYNFSLTQPQQGTLTAETGYVTIENANPYAPPPIPQSQVATATQLILKYQLPGFSGSFKLHAGSTPEIVGGVAGGLLGLLAGQPALGAGIGIALGASAGDPTIKFSFDATIGVAIAIALNPMVAPGALATFEVTNFKLSPSGTSANLAMDALNALDWLKGQPNLLDETQDLPAQNITAQISGLLGPLQQISASLGQAMYFGFMTLVPTVTPTALSPAPSGNTVELDLTHPVDPPPIVQTGPASGPLLPAPTWIQASPAELPAGDNLTVSGGSFPPAQATQLVFEWGDTTSGSVMQSMVKWGQTTQPGVPPANPIALPPIARAGADDGDNQFTATSLQPSTWYGFQVQDFDVYFPELAVPVVIGTPPSEWAYLETTATDQVQIVLTGPATPSDPAGGTVTWPLGSVTIQQDGSLPQTGFQIPTGVTPQTYTLAAILNGQPLAQTQVVIEAAGTVMSPQLQVGGATLGTTAMVSPGEAVSVQGFYFDAGEVDLYVNSSSGQLLGSVNVGSSGSFTTSVVWPGSGPDAAPDPFVIAALENGTTPVTAPVLSMGITQ
jgi:hypothetical protein